MWASLLPGRRKMKIFLENFLPVGIGNKVTPLLSPVMATKWHFEAWVRTLALE
jgi:hypothetical protein